MTIAIQDGLWGLLAGSVLLLGAGVGYFLRLPQRLIAAVMAFGAGMLFSALSFELMDAAYKQGGFKATAIGFVAGAILAMLSDTMIPEAFEYAHNFTGLITVLGFLVAFMLSKYGG